ncbi:hypothetical protein SDC9_204997 [bioreactor metagenome]|uniref:Uncharacterized protein n=1 Tax=bioreactor metagenome TaxID=1076179 RepID=A0A645JCN1_9ZZZZ
MLRVPCGELLLEVVRVAVILAGEVAGNGCPGIVDVFRQGSDARLRGGEVVVDLVREALALRGVNGVASCCCDFHKF